jgi:hypothetical protein
MLGPLGRFKPVAPAVDVCAYSPEVGRGMNVGVAGRETGVGIELTVVVVLTLLRPSVEVDSRDCGLLKPEECTFWDGTPGVLKEPVWGESASEAKARKPAAEGGLDALLCSLSLGLVGEGESSIIRTQPEEFAGVRLFSSLSATRRLRRDGRERSSGDLND